MALEVINRLPAFIKYRIPRLVIALFPTLLTFLLSYAYDLGISYYLLGLFIFLSALSLKSATFLLLFFIPLKYQLQSYGIFPDTLLTVFVPVILVSSVATEVFYRVRPIKFSETDFYLVLFIAFSVPSTLLSGIAYEFNKYQLLDFFVFAQALGFYLLGKLFLDDSFSVVAKFNLILANFVAVHGIFQYLFTPGFGPWLESFETISFRSYGIMGNPNAFSGYLLMTLFFSIPILKNRISYLSLSPLVLGIFLSHSRGSLIALAIPALVIYIRRSKNFKRSLVLGGAVLTAIFTGFFSRMASLLNSDFLFNSSVSGRIWALKNVIYINSQSVFTRIFGNGWGSYGGEFAYGGLSKTYHRGIQSGSIGVPNTDNQWLQIYAQQGIIGVALLLMFFISSFLKNVKKTSLSYVALSGMILMIFIDLIQFYQISAILFFVLGFLNSDAENGTK